MLDYKVVNDFVENMNRCKNCSGCEEGCTVCGQWYPYISPERMYPEEYRAAEEIVKQEDEELDILNSTTHKPDCGLMYNHPDFTDDEKTQYFLEHCATCTYMHVTCMYGE